MPANNVHIPLIIHEGKDSNKDVVLRVESNHSEELYATLSPILCSPRKRNGCYEVLEKNRQALYARLYRLFGYKDEEERIEMAREGKLCTVRVCLNEWPDASCFELFGFQWVWRSEKTYPVCKHRFVNIDDTHGGFPYQGGSRKNPRLAPLPDTYLEALYIPISIAEKAIQERPELFHASGCGIVKEPKHETRERIGHNWHEILPQMLLGLEKERREKDAQTLIDNIERHRVEVEKQRQRIKTLPGVGAGTPGAGLK